MIMFFQILTILRPPGFVKPDQNEITPGMTAQRFLELLSTEDICDPNVKLKGLLGASSYVVLPLGRGGPGVGSIYYRLH